MRSGGGAEAAEAANPLWAAVRKSGRDGALPSKIAVWLRVRRVSRGASSRALITYIVKGALGRIAEERRGRAGMCVGGIGVR